MIETTERPTKYRSGQVICDLLEKQYTHKQCLFAIVDIVEDGPIFARRVWYIMQNLETRELSQGLQSIIEEPGRCELVA